MPPTNHLHMQGLELIIRQYSVMKVHLPNLMSQMAVEQAYSAEAYSSDEDYFRDVAATYAADWQNLYDEGLHSIEIENPCLLFFVSDEFRSGRIA